MTTPAPTAATRRSNPRGVLRVARPTDVILRMNGTTRLGVIDPPAGLVETPQPR
jgi:hypothetical protein